MKLAIHLQIIRTVWTKQSRGGNGARSRAAVLLAFPVAANALKHGQLSVEIINFGEPNFARPQNHKTELLSLNEPLHLERGAFKFDWDGQNACTGWRWSWYNVGAPEPKFSLGHAGQLEIAPDSWVRLRWNGRFSDRDEGSWWYQQTVVNVARCDSYSSVDFSGEPARLFEWLPMLR